jgi:ketosteroid isomerase-like protein
MMNQHTLSAFYESRANSDLERHLECVHPQCAFQIIGTESLLPLARRFDDPAEIRAVAGELFDTWDFSRVEIVSSHECGDTAYVHRRGEVVYRPDGSTLPTELLDKVSFKDSKIIEYLQFVDTLALATFVAEKTGRRYA